MTSIDPATLPALSAPLWFIEFFKVLGFVLHSIPMHLWLVGLPLAVLLMMIGGPNAKNFARRLFRQLPILMALGINFGIVPLLFVQAAYYKAFYPATVLTAWHWFGILILVLPAYYLLYIASASAGSGRKWRTIFAGQTAWILLVGAGLIFASVWTFMVRPELWPDVWRQHSMAAAATGLGTHWRDPAVFIRFLSVVGLGFVTVAFWAVFDAWFLYDAQAIKTSAKPKEPAAPTKPATQYSFNSAPAKPAQQEYKDFMDNPNLSNREKKRLKKLRDRGKLSIEEELAALESKPASAASSVKKEKPQKAAAAVPDEDSYRRWTLRFAACVAWFGLFLAGGFLWFYYYKTLTPEVPNMAFLFQSAAKFLPMATLGSIGLFFVVLAVGRFGRLRGRRLTIALALCEGLVLTLYAVTRQLIQNAQLREYLDLSQIPVAVQTTPMIAFLSVFLLGAAVIFFMIRAVAQTR